jgi:hypothetical protein
MRTKINMKNKLKDIFVFYQEEEREKKGGEENSSSVPYHAHPL